MTSWHPSRALLLVLALGAIGGCAGGAGSTTTQARHSGGFITQLSAACRADAAATRRAPKTGVAQAAAQHRFIQTLLTLSPPHGLKPAFSRYVSALQRNLAAFERHDVATSERLATQIEHAAARLRRAGAAGC